MATLDQVLKKHLFTTDYEAIHAQFQDDPSDLIREEGVNYEYEGKIWNIRILPKSNESQEIISLFIRLYSEEVLWGYQFSEYSDDKIQKLWTLKDETGGGSGTSPLCPKNKELRHKFRDVIQGRRRDNMEVPKITKKLIERLDTDDIFKQCPSLIPPYFEPNPLPEAGLSLEKKYLSGFFVIATVYLMIKKLRSQEPVISPLNSSGTDAIA
ncbi:MAG: hypothetical protein AB7N99_07330 [Simkaniaceae bacterium]